MESSIFDPRISIVLINLVVFNSLDADGGAGWLISRKLLERIQGEISTTLHNSPGCYDDVAFGNYMISIGVSLRQGPFHNEDFAYILPDKIEERNEKTDLQLKVYHNFHQQHKGFPAFKPISFHMRFVFMRFSYFMKIRISSWSTW